MIALLAPGQGSQKPGMLAPWLADPTAAATLRHWSDVVGLDLAHLGSAASAEDITDTAVTQPLVVASALLAARALLARTDLPAAAPTAGHSVGELAAAAVAGVIDDDTAVALAALRGREMAAACAAEPTGMSAVLGGDEQTVLDRLAELGLDPANRNGAGQIVAAGPRAALAELAGAPPAGSRVITLAVAGAFHTRFMAPAAAALQAAVAQLTPADPVRPLLSNADGSVLTDGAGVLDHLAAQVTRPVRWDACMTTMAERGVTAVVELPPAGTLTGLVKRELKGTATLALKTPDQLTAAADLITEHVGADR